MPDHSASDFTVHQPGEDVTLPCQCKVRQTNRSTKVIGFIYEVNCKPHFEAVREAFRKYKKRVFDRMPSGDETGVQKFSLEPKRRTDTGMWEYEVKTVFDDNGKSYAVCAGSPDPFVKPR